LACRCGLGSSRNSQSTQLEINWLAPAYVAWMLGVVLRWTEHPAARVRPAARPLGMPVLPKSDCSAAQKGTHGSES
jgi:hypothetical protein